FGGDTDILGRTILLDDEPVTVVGVMPEGLDDTQLTGTAAVWRPLVFTEEERRNRGWNWLNCVGRLKPDISIKQAGIEMNTLASRLEQTFPGTNSGSGVRL